MAHAPETFTFTPGFFLLALCLLIYNCRMCACESQGIVAELTDEYFEEGLLDYNHAIVLFYSPQCVHCSNFLPTFKMAADELIRNEPPVHAAMVDCAAAGLSTCQQEEIHHLPTVKIYRRGMLYDEYDGARTLDALVAYMKKLVGITSIELSMSDIEKFANSQKDVAVVAVLRPQGNLRDNYFSLPAELSKDIRFGHVIINEETLNKMADVSYGVTMYYPAHMRSKFEAWEYSYNVINEGYDLLEFILRHRHGIVGLRNIRHVDDFVPPLVIAYFKFDIYLNPKMFIYWRNRILKVAKDYVQYFNFAISPIDDFQNEFNKFGISFPAPEDKESPLILVVLEDKTKYLLAQEFTSDSFEVFLKDILNGTAEPHLKSQPIPEHVEDGVVGTVVAKNFKEVIWGNKKDILLEFFAPWCRFCKELGIVLDEVAKIMLKENLVIYKMDATENEIPADFDTPRFPTLYFISRGDKDNPILYEGGANAEELIEFIAQHSSNDLGNLGKKPKKVEL